MITTNALLPYCNASANEPVDVFVPAAGGYPAIRIPSVVTA